jgi:hypothetical protein
MKVFRIVIVVFYLIRCPIAVYHLTATALELARIEGGVGVTTYATEPSTKHPALSKNPQQNLRGLTVAPADLRLAITDERIRIADVALAHRPDTRQIPTRSPPLFA